MNSIRKQGIASPGSGLQDACSGAWVGGQVQLPLLTWTADLPSLLLSDEQLLQIPEGSLLYRCSKLIALSIGRRPAPSLTSMKAPSLDGHLQFHRIPRAHCQWEIVPSHPLSSLPLALSASFFPFRFLWHEKFLWRTVRSVPQAPGHTYQSFFATLLLRWDSQYTSHTISHFQISFSLGSFSLVHWLKVGMELASPNLIPHPTLSKSCFKRCSTALWTKRVVGA